MNRIEKAIRRWAEVTGQPVADWAINSWVEILGKHTAGEDRIIEAMTYLVCGQVKPNLTELTELLENGVPRAWKARQNAFKDVDDTTVFLRRIFQCMAASDPQEKLLECIQEYKGKYPHLDWGEVERETQARLTRKQAIRSHTGATGDDIFNFEGYGEGGNTSDDTEA